MDKREGWLTRQIKMGEKTTRIHTCVLMLSMILLFIISSVASVQAQATTVSMPEVTKPHDSYATLPVTLHNVQNYGTGTISITYNPAVVHVTDVSDGPQSTVVDWNADDTSGTVIISAWNTKGVSGDIIFANVTFHAVGSPGTSTILKLDVTTLKDISIKDIPVSVSDGTFSIKEDGGIASSPTPTPAVTPTPATLTPTPTPSPTMQPSPTPLPTGGGEEKATPITSRWKLPGFESIFACFAFISAFIILMVKIRWAKRG